MSKKKNSKSQSPIQRKWNLGNAIYLLVVGALIAFAIWSLSGRLSLIAASSSESATNPIGIEQSSHPTDTDIASLQAAERGQLNQPALVWFHADW
ncbi:MAG: hypothetical protein HY070_08650 [Chloroflexi bacterium]|nr:hypothetical protein [Chloroflexota bacterium]